MIPSCRRRGRGVPAAPSRQLACHGCNAESMVVQSARPFQRAGKLHQRRPAQAAGRPQKLGGAGAAECTGTRLPPPRAACVQVVTRRQQKQTAPTNRSGVRPASLGGSQQQPLRGWRTSGRRRLAAGGARLEKPRRARSLRLSIQKLDQSSLLTSEWCPSTASRTDSRAACPARPREFSGRGPGGPRPPTMRSNRPITPSRRPIRALQVLVRRGGGRGLLRARPRLRRRHASHVAHRGRARWREIRHQVDEGG